ncbi:MAG: hypothetical protein ACK5G7_03125 [Erysipelotrichaceae bacterium]
MKYYYEKLEDLLIDSTNYLKANLNADHIFALIFYNSKSGYFLSPYTRKNVDDIRLYYLQQTIKNFNSELIALIHNGSKDISYYTDLDRILINNRKLDLKTIYLVGNNSIKYQYYPQINKEVITL